LSLHILILLIRRRFVTYMFCSGYVLLQETFYYGDVLLRRRFVWRRFVEETFCAETLCMCAVYLLYEVSTLLLQFLGVKKYEHNAIFQIFLAQACCPLTFYISRSKIFRIESPNAWQIPMFGQIFPMRNMGRLCAKHF
jgi:hypothetical protein